MAAVGVQLYFLLLLLLLTLFQDCFVYSLHFHIRDAELKCFREEMPEEVLLVGTYRTQLYDQQRDRYLPAPQDLRMLIVAKDPDNQLVLSQLSDSEGRFSITSHKPGEHRFCLQSTSSQPAPSAGGVLAVHLEIKMGFSTNNYTKIIAEDRLTELQLRVRQLTDQVKQIQKQQTYQKLRQKHFRDISHNTEMWIFWWPVVRSLYVVAVITWHTKSW
ncbi:transmembrane emp24 domain-containing protein 9-like isoform X2 [Echeneis naucrates]|uniref:Transmembrane emp24 domain-containing protein 9-like n=1 Tax=Echeneis naucrates TaxID=173247 RepID=A0A665V1R2_ECHNA|nr:transmembrane emp24 domain-containing protein 9-like isoform X1 [Echeneis naucrates]XP_029368045.1 transmembrane emp24 domain-containing protein 9-like isoform X1 [Echeneis naucrates]XP_029368046.1 transmembrane emp24 domain-containing protein 9-like isoform X2 [Echeneis naucrates]